MKIFNRKISIIKFLKDFSNKSGISVNKFADAAAVKALKKRAKEENLKPKFLQVDIEVSLCKELSTETESLYIAKAKTEYFEVLGVGKTPQAAKRQLHKNLKRVDKFARTAQIIVGLHTGLYKYNISQNISDDKQEALSEDNNEQ